MAINLCLITGTVLRPDGSAFAGGTITFNSVIPQNVQGTAVPATEVSATTDNNGNINGGSGISLIQGLFVQVALTLNGNMYSQSTAVVPQVSAASFASLIAGITLGGAQSITAGTWTPTLIGSTTAGSTTYSIQKGYWLQIVTATQTWNNLTYWVQGTAYTGTGFAAIGGIPANNISDSGLAWCVGSCGAMTGLTISAGFAYFGTIIPPSGTFLYISQNPVNGGSWAQLPLLNANIAPGGWQILGEIRYRSV